MADSNLRLPRYRELADSFTAECLLMIVRHRDYRVGLTPMDDDIAIEEPPAIPDWLVTALRLYRTDLIELMHAGFLGDWTP